jgi:hypothetical protein
MAVFLLALMAIASVHTVINSFKNYQYLIRGYVI